MHFANITEDEIDIVFDLYDRAIEFQKTVFHKSWLGFDRQLVETEIVEERIWKIEDDGTIACIYSVTYSDPVIWGEKSGESAMYIHRIVTNPDFRGRGYVRSITGWATDFARSNNLRFVRMDTWGDNQKLIDYYKDCGFGFRGVVTPKKSAELPKHYSDINLSLFEIDLENG
ncbi:MAG: GNAT family N-acetyltransferase [Acidobacteriota bacterium]